MMFLIRFGRNLTKKDSVESTVLNVKWKNFLLVLTVFGRFFHGSGCSRSDPDFWPIRIRKKTGIRNTEIGAGTGPAGTSMFSKPEKMLFSSQKIYIGRGSQNIGAKLKIPAWFINNQSIKQYIFSYLSIATFSSVMVMMRTCFLRVTQSLSIWNCSSSSSSLLAAASTLQQLIPAMHANDVITMSSCSLK